jgi:hypothetical protein
MHSQQNIQYVSAENGHQEGATPIFKNLVNHDTICGVKINTE